MDSVSKLDIIKQSIQGSLEVPAYEAIAQEEERAAQAESQQGAPQQQGQQQAVQMPPLAPVPPPPAQAIPQSQPSSKEFVTPGKTGVGLNQTSGSRNTSFVQPGQYRDGGIKQYEEGGPKRPKGKKDIMALQALLVDEGYDLGEFGANGDGVDGDWGEDTAKAYAKYTNRTSSDSIGTMDWLKGQAQRTTLDSASQSVQSYVQYLANSMLQHYGFVKDDESFFDVDEDDLRADELASYKSILRDNLNKGKDGVVDYRDYSNKSDVKNASSSSAALKVLKSRGVANTLIDDFLPSGSNSTREALYALTGNANYTIDELGNVHVSDSYDFNPSQKNIEKTGASAGKVWDEITKGKYDNPWQNAHSAADHIKSKLPVDINLGSYRDLGLSLDEVKSLKKYVPHETKKVSLWDMAKNVTGYSEGGFKKTYKKGGIKGDPPTNADKARKYRMMRPAQGENYALDFEQAPNTHSTHLSRTYEADGKYYSAPSVTNDRAPYADSVYHPQSFRQAMNAGEGIPFDTEKEAAKFAGGSWKLPQYPRPSFENGGVKNKKKKKYEEYTGPTFDPYKDIMSESDNTQVNSTAELNASFQTSEGTHWSPATGKLQDNWDGTPQSGEITPDNILPELMFPVGKTLKLGANAVKTTKNISKAGAVTPEYLSTMSKGIVKKGDDAIVSNILKPSKAKQLKLEAPTPFYRNQRLADNVKADGRTIMDPIDLVNVNTRGSGSVPNNMTWFTPNATKYKDYGNVRYQTYMNSKNPFYAPKPEVWSVEKIKEIMGKGHDSIYVTKGIGGSKRLKDLEEAIPLNKNIMEGLHRTHKNGGIRKKFNHGGLGPHDPPVYDPYADLYSASDNTSVYNNTQETLNTKVKVPFNPLLDEHLNDNLPGYVSPVIPEGYEYDSFRNLRPEWDGTPSGGEITPHNIIPEVLFPVGKTLGLIDKGVKSLKALKTVKNVKSTVPTIPVPNINLNTATNVIKKVDNPLVAAAVETTSPLNLPGQAASNTSNVSELGFTLPKLPKFPWNRPTPTPLTARDIALRKVERFSGTEGVGLNNISYSNSPNLNYESFMTSPNPGEAVRFMNELASGADKFDSVIANRVRELSTTRGTQRLADMYSPSMAPMLNSHTSLQKAKMRIDRLRNAPTYNRMAADYKAANIVGNTNIQNSNFASSSLFNNAAYFPKGATVGQYGVQVRPEDMMGLGTTHVDNVPTMHHEINHFLQKGERTVLDTEFAKITPKDDLSPEAMSAYDYFVRGSNGNSREPTAFGAELRSVLMEKGYMKYADDGYFENVTPEQLEVAYRELTKNPAYRHTTKNNDIFTAGHTPTSISSPQRIFDFMGPTKTNFTLLANSLNQLPMVAGAAALGAKTYSDGKETQGNGGI